VIHERQGNLLGAEVDALVNTVNTVGVMGKGIALQFKQAFPGNYKAYREACKRGDVKIGEMFVFDSHRLGARRYVINFPTKRHWRAKSHISDIALGLPALIEVVRKHGISSIAVPALGCGNGGLDWAEVRPMIVAAFQEVPDVQVTMFPPAGAPEPNEMPVGTAAPAMSRGRAALVLLINSYAILAGSERVEAPSGASLLEIQKLMYLLQVLGQPMRLTFEKGRYGPYAENLNHQLQLMEGHLTRGYGDRSQKVLDLDPIALLPGAVDSAQTWMSCDQGGLQETIAKLLDLIDGFASPYGLELLSTVHWIAVNEIAGERHYADLVIAVQSWSRRKSEIFTEHHIRAATRRLIDRKLIDGDGFTPA